MAFKYGRRRPVAHAPCFKLKNYLTRSLPVPPVAVDYSKAALASLSNLYLNDRFACCVISGIAHVVGVLTGNAGVPVLYAPEDILHLYSAIGGYVPGDPSTDGGCDEPTALSYWATKGAPEGEHKIAGWLAVNPADPIEYRTALLHFENLYLGLALPDPWVTPMPAESGFTWDVAGAPDQDNGHCVIACAYDQRGLMISTWGMLGVLTDAAVAKYCADASGGALYTVVSMDALRTLTKTTPEGLDWSQLVADFAGLGGTVLG